MMEEVARLVPPVALEDRNDVWWQNTKASDDFLDRLFEKFYERLGTANLMRKTNYHKLAQFVPIGLLDPEIREKLDLIESVAHAATPPNDMEAGNLDGAMPDEEVQ
jgi:hypothetical protein